MRTRALCAVLGLAACAAGPARAHAPLPRAVAVAPDGSGAVVVRMPGFGFLLRGDRGASFAYACDALYGVSPIDENAPMAYRADGTLLVGTLNGLRVIEPSGCPRAEIQLPHVAVRALAVHETGRLYAITQADAAPVLQRSDDDGETWTLGATLGAEPVTALVLDASDAERVFVSQNAPPGALLSASSDGGASFETIELAEPLIVLHARGSRLWARARIVDQPVGVRIAQAESLEGPWEAALDVNFFGGFAIDGDVIFVGDEARGVFRSDDGGESFEETQPDLSSASLAYGDDALWSCTPGLPSDTALARSSDAREAFEPVMAFDDVRELVACDTALAVESICAAALAEWQRDVLLLTPPDADAGVMPAPDAAAMQEPDASAPADAGADATVEPRPLQREPSGCSAVAGRGAGAWPALFAILALCRPRKAIRLHLRGRLGFIGRACCTRRRRGGREQQAT